MPTSRATRVTSSANDEQLVDHRVDRCLERERPRPCASTVIFWRQVAVGHRGRRPGRCADLAGQVRRHEVDVVGEVLPGAGDAAHLRPGRRACPRCRPRGRRGSPRRRTTESWSTIVLMVSLSSRISPRASTVIFCDRSPWATAVVTWAMLRTWSVRFAAMKLTLSVRSRQVPETPSTSAWPPSLPSVPTSRATRVTSSANERELVDHRVDGVLELEDLALGVDGDLLGQVALGHRGRDLGDVAHLAGQVRRP